MSSEITGVLSLKNPIIMCIMNGGLMFTGEIMRGIFPLEFDYVHASRYGDNIEPGKDLRWKKHPSRNLKDRCVLLLDDVLDEELLFQKLKSTVMIMVQVKFIQP